MMDERIAGNKYLFFGKYQWYGLKKESLLLGRAKWQGLHNLSFHGFDEGHGVGHDIVPLRVHPGRLTTLLPVCKALVTPDMVDGMKLTQLSEESSIWNILPDRTSVLDSSSPIVAPIIHGARFQIIR